MAAISALLLASARVFGQADVRILPGTYSETVELIDGYARHLRKVILAKEDAVAKADQALHPSVGFLRSRRRIRGCPPQHGRPTWIFSFSIRPVLPEVQAKSGASCDGLDAGTCRQ